MFFFSAANPVEKHCKESNPGCSIETYRTPAGDGNFDKKEKQRGTSMIEKNTIRFIENALKKGKKLQLEYNKKTGELKILELIPHIIFKENVKE